MKSNSEDQKLKILHIRLSDREQKIISALYKLADIHTDNRSEAFRELLDFLKSEFFDKKEQLERIDPNLVELPPCPKVPTLVTRGTNRGLVFCSSPKTVGLRKGNHVELEVCKNCWQRQESEREESGIPTPKQELAPTFTDDETQKVSKKKPRTCIDCGTNISYLEEWKTRCGICYRKHMNPTKEDTGLAGSPLDLRKKEADAIRRANERINTREKD